MAFSMKQLYQESDAAPYSLYRKNNYVLYACLILNHTLASEVAVCAPLPIATRRAPSRFKRPWFTSAKGCASSSWQACTSVSAKWIRGQKKTINFSVQLVILYMFQRNSSNCWYPKSLSKQQIMGQLFHQSRSSCSSTVL